MTSMTIDAQNFPELITYRQYALFGYHFISITMIYCLSEYPLREFHLGVLGQKELQVI